MKRKQTKYYYFLLARLLLKTIATFLAKGAQVEEMLKIAEQNQQVLGSFVRQEAST